jgi:hypothetical protein
MDVMTITITEVTEKRTIIKITRDDDETSPEPSVAPPTRPNQPREYYTPEERRQLWNLLPERLKEVLRVAAARPEGIDRSELMRHFNENPGQYGSRFRAVPGILARFGGRPEPYEMRGSRFTVRDEFRRLIEQLPPEER